MATVPLAAVTLANASEDALDLGVFVNGGPADSTVNRAGNRLRTIQYYESLAQNAISNLGYQVPVAYTAGISITSARQTVTYDGERYSANPASIPFTTGATFNPAQWMLMGEGLPSSDVFNLAGGFDPMLDGAVGDGTTNDTAAVVAASSRGKLLYINHPHVVSGSLTLDTVVFGPNGLIKPAAGATVLMMSVVAPNEQQIFDTSAGGQITLGQQTAYVDWWGDVEGGGDAATKALPIFGGTVRYAQMKKYKPNRHAYGFDGPGLGFFKANVTYEGRGRGYYNADVSEIVGGTVLAGPVLYFADNITFRNLSVDSGKKVVTDFYGGVVSPGAGGEGLLGTYPNNAAKAASQQRKGATLENVLTLCPFPDSPVHALLVEGYDGVHLSGDISVAYGTHGMAIKSKNVSMDNFSSFLTGGEGLTIKTDIQTSAAAQNVTIGSMHIQRTGPAGSTPHTAATSGVGLEFNATGGAIDKVQIAQYLIDGYGTGVRTVFAGSFTVIDIRLGQGTVDLLGAPNPVAALTMISGGGQSFQGWRLDSLCARNVPAGAIFSFYQADGNAPNRVSIGSLHVVNASDVAVDMGYQSYVDISNLCALNCNVAMYRISGGRLKVGIASKGANFADYTTTVSPSPFGLPAGHVALLQNGWANYGGNNDAFSVSLTGGRVFLSGLLINGTTNTVGVLPEWARPFLTLRATASGKTGSAQPAVPITIDTGGVITINELSGGTANAEWLSLSGISWAQF